jgi:carbon storage regulator
MLVLSRKRNESIVIGHLFTVTVVEIRGDRVRLGVDAPKDVPVHRGEIEAKIASQQSADMLPLTLPIVQCGCPAVSPQPAAG